MNLRIVLLFLCFPSFAQMKIYYNRAGEITIRDLATHYRIAQIDPINERFVGKVEEFSMDSIKYAEFFYGNNGIPDGVVNLPDSVKGLINKKESFAQSNYIRKNEYPQLKNLLTAMKAREDSIKLIGIMFTIVEDPPSFPGGMNALGEFLNYYLVYPKSASDKQIKGKVLVQFTIDTDGCVTDVKTIKGLGHGCDEAAELAVSKLPDWKPGYQRSKAVKVKKVIPISF